MNHVQTHLDPNLDQVIIEKVSDALNRSITEIRAIYSARRQSSTITQLEIEFSRGPSLRAWAKTLHPSGDENVQSMRTMRDFDLHQHLNSVMMKHDGPFRVPRAICYSAEHRLIVTEHADGIRLQDRIESRRRFSLSRRGRPDLPHDCRLAGQWLKAFQDATRGYFPGKALGLPAQRYKGTQRIIDQATERLEKLSTLDSRYLPASFLDEIRAFLKQAKNSLVCDQRMACCIHGDFFPGNLLIDESRVSAIDFTSSTWGEPAFDASYFVYQLETLHNSYRYSADFVSRLRNAFIEGYLGCAPESDYWNHTPLNRTLFVTLSLSRLLAINSRRIQNLKAARYLIINRALRTRLERTMAGQ